MSPRRRRDSSYVAQFCMRYFVLYFGVTLLFVRADISISSWMRYASETGSAKLEDSVNESHAPTPWGGDKGGRGDAGEKCRPSPGCPEVWEPC